MIAPGFELTSQRQKVSRLPTEPRGRSGTVRRKKANKTKHKARITKRIREQKADWVPRDAFTNNLGATQVSFRRARTKFLRLVD